MCGPGESLHAGWRERWPAGLCKAFILKQKAPPDRQGFLRMGWPDDYSAVTTETVRLFSAPLMLNFTVPSTSENRV